jgi:nucleobase:cation symporter-1, NCS1 family
MLCAIATDMAGLINSINPSIKVGGAARLFDLAWLYGVRLIL